MIHVRQEKNAHEEEKQMELKPKRKGLSLADPSIFIGLHKLEH